GCLGALNGTYINVRVPSKDRGRYRNRKGQVSVNVLGVCDRNMNFVYMLCGWEGSAADNRVLRDAITRANSLRVPNGQYYLVDGGYTNGSGFLSPYRGVRYHLDEWGTGSRTPQNFRELYNLRHAKARNAIERAFGILKMRWAILRSNSFYPIRTQNRIIMACALIHNFIRTTMPEDPIENEIPEFPIPSNPPSDDDYIDQVESSPEWTQKRDLLAQQIKIVMEPSMTSGTGKEGGATSKRCVWTSAEENALVNALKDILTEGWKTENGFITGYTFQLEKKMKTYLPGCEIRADPHITSKMHVWKKTYASLANIKSNKSGLGWNDVSKSFSCNDDKYQSLMK
ncbi:Unknown protein, partial [Striga hermonthica]